MEKKGILWIIITIAVVIEYVVCSGVFAPLLPKTVPLHYNGKGEPDKWGNKSTIFIIFDIVGPFIYVFIPLIIQIVRCVPIEFDYWLTGSRRSETIRSLTYWSLGLGLILTECIFILFVFILVQSLPSTDVNLILIGLYVVLPCLLISIVVYTVLLYCHYRSIQSENFIPNNSDTQAVNTTHINQQTPLLN